MPRLAIVTSHPIQYYGPLFRRLAQRVELQVMFAHAATKQNQAQAGFGTGFDWDVDITSGYPHAFLRNVSKDPGTHCFSGCDTPEVASVLREGRFDAVLVMGWHLKSYFQAIIEAKRLGLPVMVRGDSHLATPRSPLKQAAKALIYPHLLRQFDAALYVGQMSRAYYRHYCFPEDRLFFSPHCVDANWFASRATPDERVRLRGELGIRPESFALLFSGKLISSKRTEDLLRSVALTRAQGADMEVMIAGDGELRARLVAVAEEMGVPTHFLGFLNQSRMPAAYAASDALVLTSAHETWGLVANEAIACGRPIIVTDACGCSPDLIDRLKAGASYPVGDVAALALAISGLQANPPTAETLRRASATHSLDAAADGVLTALQRVAPDPALGATP